MVLADFGATVIKIDRAGSSSVSNDCLARGKRSIAVNLKNPEGQRVVQRLASKSDVIIEPFRPGSFRSNYIALICALCIVMIFFLHSQV